MFEELKDKQMILKEISEDFDISFDAVHEEYYISHKGFPFRRVGMDGFTRELVDEIRRIVWLNENGDIESEIEENNAKIERDNEQRQTDFNYEIAKDMRKAILKDT